MNKDITFRDLNLHKDIVNAIEKAGLKIPTEIQEKVIPLLLEKKHDVIGIAQTGTGKTAAFGLPIINNIDTENKMPKSIILAPTRELALQITSEFKKYSSKKRLNILTVYGGSSINLQIKELRRGVDIVVGTPGRVLDLLKRKVLNLNFIEYFILDEADEMLNMGFVDDIESIFRNSNRNKRVLLFSATMPQKVKELSKKYMKKQVIIETKKKVENSNLIEHFYTKVKYSDKSEALKQILKRESFIYGIIFCKTKVDVDNITRNLRRDIPETDCIHGDIPQRRREKILDKFRKQKVRLLVATDVAARGIDVNNITHIINYSKPNDVEIYTHRVGRTGRAGNKGIAISLLTPKEIMFVKEVENQLKIKLNKLDLGKFVTNKNNSSSDFEYSNKDSKSRFKNKDRKTNFKKNDKKFDSKKKSSSKSRYTNKTKFNPKNKN